MRTKIGKISHFQPDSAQNPYFRFNNPCQILTPAWERDLGAGSGEAGAAEVTEAPCVTSPLLLLVLPLFLAAFINEKKS